MSTRRTADIVWFRRDLRLVDNPAWAGAAASGRPVCALFVIDPRLSGGCGDRRRNLLLAHLAELDRDLVALGGRLRVERGDPGVVVPRVAAELGDARIFLNGDTTPYSRRRDRAVGAALGERLVESWGTLVHRPGDVLTRAGSVSQVFTPYWRAWEATPWRQWATLDAGSAAPDVLGDNRGRLPAQRRRAAGDAR